MWTGGGQNLPRREQLLERVVAVGVATLMTFLLFIVLYRMTTDWTWFTHQYLGPLRDDDEIWGRLVSGGLLLVVLGWGVFCVGLALIDVYARLRGASPLIKVQQWIAGLAVSVVALVLTFLVGRAG